jgi:hypothetical protein
MTAGESGRAGRWSRLLGETGRWTVAAFVSACAGAASLLHAGGELVWDAYCKGYGVPTCTSCPNPGLSTTTACSKYLPAGWVWGYCSFTPSWGCYKTNVGCSQHMTCKSGDLGAECMVGEYQRCDTRS